MAVASVALDTAISVATDMTEGIIARFRTMAVARLYSVLTGHVLRAVIQTMIALAVALADRAAARVPHHRPTRRLARRDRGPPHVHLRSDLAHGRARPGQQSVETASNLPMFLMLLPFLGSGFVPTASMPSGLRWFAENQPFTPVIETIRGLLLGTHHRQ